VRRAVTLIEMLIVLFIISLLAVMALRALPNEDQKPREAARMLNGYITSAKIQAANVGRPAGIILRPWSAVNSPATTYANFSTLIEQCEVPPTYAGDAISAMLVAQNWTFKSDNLYYYTNASTVVKIRVKQLEFSNLIRRGDKIQLNAQGPIYTIGYDDSALRNPLGVAPPLTLPDIPLDANNEYLDFTNAGITTDADGWITSHCITLFLEPIMALPLPWPTVTLGTWSSPIPFSITCQPTKSAATPLQLPSGAGVDLAFSGTDDFAYSGSANSPNYGDYRFHNNSANPPPVVIMFTPNGAVDSLYIGTARYRPTTTIYLLLGKMTVSSETDNNWFDLKNVIVSINPQTGTVSTNPVYPAYYNTSTPNPGPPFANDPPASMKNEFTNPMNPPTLDTSKDLTNASNAAFIQALFYSRKFAREAQTMGGKR
jgi:prepilin-type N-terminal cleavage/methylation domain-containing protein